MIYLIIGSNKERVDKEVERVCAKTFSVRIDAFNWDTDLVRSKIESTSLFATEKEILILDNISENSEAWGDLKNIVSESQEEVIILERDLKKDDAEFFERVGAKISDLRDMKGFEYDFSPFALQDAIGERNAKKAWIEYMKLRGLGIEAEEVVPKIINKMRDMLSIEKGATKSDLNIKSDFPYNKSKKDFKNWELRLAERFYGKLISIYHEARSERGANLSITLEKELLKI